MICPMDYYHDYELLYHHIIEHLYNLYLQPCASILQQKCNVPPNLPLIQLYLSMSSAISVPASAYGIASARIERHRVLVCHCQCVNKNAFQSCSSFEFISDWISPSIGWFPECACC
jgi:hypothetical protein